MVLAYIGLLAFWLVVKFHETGISPVRALCRRVGKSRLESLVLAVCICGFVHYGATKGLVGGASSVLYMGLAQLPTVSSEQVESDGLFSEYTNAVTNVCFTGVCPSTTSVFLRAAWPTDCALPESRLEIYATPCLTNIEWTGVGVMVADTNANEVVAELPYSWFSDEGSVAGFFTLGLVVDTDGDGLTDSFERLVSHTDPNSADTDGDGMPDGWEYEQGFDPNAYGEQLDSDGDGLPDAQERALGTDPNDDDTDDDGRDDGDEYYAGTNPLLSDTDGDGLSDGLEFQLGTNPTHCHSYEVVNNNEGIVCGTPTPRLLFSPPEESFDESILIAGREYPVSVTASSIGGPAELSFPIWGRFTPIMKPQLALKISHPAIIFEDRYQDFPGGPITTIRSSAVDISVGVRGGDLGGSLSVSTQNGSKLQFMDGDDIRSRSLAIAAGETRTWQGTFTGLAPSVTTNDIVVVVTFEENETGNVTALTNSLTSVQVELTAENEAPQPGCPHRHVFGVHEDVNYSHQPSDAEATWSFTTESQDEGITDLGGHFRCPLGSTSTNEFMKATAQVSCLGFTFSTAFNVYKPTVVARNPRVNEGNSVTSVVCEAGHLLLFTDCYAAPFFISFNHLRMQEIPDESQAGEHAGYFDNRHMGGNWSHTRADGAGRWRPVDGLGGYTIDAAGRAGRYEKPWSDGWKVWPIPMAYGYSDVTMGIAYSDPLIKQRFELTSSGTFTISKFGFTAKRNRWGLKWLNGKFVW